MAQAVLVNGVMYGWGNLTFMPFGVPLVGITKISFTRKQDKKNEMGRGYEPIGRTYGNITYEGSVEIYQEELQKWINAAPGKDLLSIPPANMKLIAIGVGVPPLEKTLYALEFDTEALEASQGDTSLKVTIPFIWAGNPNA